MERKVAMYLPITTERVHTYEALAHWDYVRKLRNRKSELGRRMAHNKPITGEGLILELGGSDE